MEQSILCYPALTMNSCRRGPSGVHLLEIGSLAWRRDLLKTARLTLDCKSDILKLLVIILIWIYLWAQGSRLMWRLRAHFLQRVLSFHLYVVSGTKLWFPGLPCLPSHLHGCSFLSSTILLKTGERHLFSGLSQSSKSQCFPGAHRNSGRADTHMQATWDGWEVVHMRPCRLSVCDHAEWISIHHLRVQRVCVGCELSWV